MLQPTRQRKTVFIGQVSSDLKYTRKIQHILEKNGFVTSILRLAQAEPGYEHPIHRQYPQAHPNLIGLYSLLREQDSEFIDVHMSIVSSVFDRLQSQTHQPTTPYFVIDIEDCLFIDDDDELEQALENVLHQQFTEEAANAHYRLSTEFSAKDYALLDEAKEILRNLHHYSDQALLEKFYATRGQLIKAMLFAMKNEGVMPSVSGKLNVLSQKYTSYSAEAAGDSIFISHATADLPTVRAVQIALEERGYRTYLFTAGYLRDLQGQRGNVVDWDERERILALSHKLKARLVGDMGIQNQFIKLWNNALTALGLVNKDEVDALTNVFVCEYVFTLIRWEIEAPIVDFVLEVASPHSHDSLWVSVEKEFALKIGKPVYILPIDDVTQQVSSRDVGHLIDDMFARNEPITQSKHEIAPENLGKVFLVDHWRTFPYGKNGIQISMHRRELYTKQFGQAFNEAETFLRRVHPRGDLDSLV